jgi:hypothetical protein
MKSTFITALPLLGAALAAPAVRRSEYDIKITLTNDLSGASATHGVPSGGFNNSVSSIWAQDENFMTEGAIKASSAMLNEVNPNGKFVTCKIRIDGGEPFILSTEQTFVDLDGTPRAILVDLTEATVSCEVEDEQAVPKLKTKRSEFDISVTLIDDRTGAKAEAKVPSGGSQNAVKSLWRDPGLIVGGRIRATSAQLTHPTVDGDRRIDCSFINSIGGVAFAVFNSLQTWVDLDGIVGPELVDLTNAKIACFVKREQRFDAGH